MTRKTLKKLITAIVPRLPVLKQSCKGRRPSASPTAGLPAGSVAPLY